MGDEIGDLTSWSSPVHSVRVSSFYLAQFSVTQKLWQLVMEKEWSHLAFVGNKRPMEQVSWDDAQIFLEKLEQKTDLKFRLPSEAEWEYAARGGRYNQSCRYAGSERIKEVAWYWENSHKETKPLGHKMSNELGLYDMSGNVFEWCSGNFENNDEVQPSRNTSNDASSTISMKVNRGGGWGSIPNHCRNANCNGYPPQFQNMFLGFRIALSY